MYVNSNKKEIITVNGIEYSRYAIKTHVITKDDNMMDVVQKYTENDLIKGDIVFISEKAVACTQSRAIALKDIKPRKLAVFLSNHVHKTKHGIGLGMPETMEMALQECGIFRILIAAGVSVIGKAIGKKGWFYNVAGEKARAIDGPCPNTIPPYNQYVVLGPLNPMEICENISKRIGHGVAIVDINDLGANILGYANIDMPVLTLREILIDNILGQSGESTPIGIIRPKGKA